MSESGWYHDKAAECNRMALASTNAVIRGRYIRDRDSWQEIAARIDAAEEAVKQRKTKEWVRSSGSAAFFQFVGDKNFGRMSAIGPKQTRACALHMSAFGGKADMGLISRITPGQQDLVEL